MQKTQIQISKIDEKIKRLLDRSILISPKERKAILKTLTTKTQKQKKELISLLESEKSELGAHIKDAFENDPEGTKKTLTNINKKGKRNLNKSKEEHEREKEEKNLEKLMDNLNQT